MKTDDEGVRRFNIGMNEWKETICIFLLYFWQRHSEELGGVLAAQA